MGRLMRLNVHQSCRELLTRLWSSEFGRIGCHLRDVLSGNQPDPSFRPLTSKAAVILPTSAATITRLERAAETPAEALTVLAARIRLPPLLSPFKNAFQALSSVPVNRPAKLSDQGFMEN